MSVDRLVKEYGIETRWSVFPLHPEIPEQGMELTVLFPHRQPDDAPARKGRIRTIAEELGLPLGEKRTTVSSSRRAQELGKWAESMGKGDLFRKAVFQAYFVANSNIALFPVLERIAAHAGLPADQVVTVLEKGFYSEAVDEDWQSSRNRGIMAVPFFLYGENALSGFRPYGDYVKLVGR